MTKTSAELVSQFPLVRSPWGRWAAYAACVWGIVFGLLSFYWALGGTAFLDSMISPALVALVRERDPLFLAILWITAFLKVFAAVVALALIRPWGRFVPDWILLLLTWGAGVLLAEHGALIVIMGSLMLSGVVGAGGTFDGAILRWYTYLWGPWFLIGGLLLIVAGLCYLRGLSRRRAGTIASVLGALGAVAVLVVLNGLGIG